MRIRTSVQRDAAAYDEIVPKLFQKMLDPVLNNRLGHSPGDCRPCTQPTRRVSYLPCTCGHSRNNADGEYRLQVEYNV